jgi:hypothetical protein
MKSSELDHYGAHTNPAWGKTLSLYYLEEDGNFVAQGFGLVWDDIESVALILLASSHNQT